MRNDFAVFILSHGRANDVLTVNTLNKCGYTGDYYIIVDDEDKQLDIYKKNFNGHIIVFSKEEVAKTFDIMDNFDGRQVPTYARNVCHLVAKDLGLKYFLELEDDYEMFRMRYDNNGKFSTLYCTQFDAICDTMIEFLERDERIKTIAFAQTGDFIGGMGSKVFKEKLSRKAMNSFFCKVDRPFQFYGRFNDDVNAYVSLGMKGELFFTIADFCLDQPQTQQRDGGITESYKQYGTYVKSFYSVIRCPSCVKIAAMGVSNKRLHHLIEWEYAVPKIINKSYKK